MSNVNKIKQARKIAYNIFEGTGKIEDYKTYKNLDNLVKQYEMENQINNQPGM